MATTIINASAGSGKTYRLAIAYIQALLSPQPDGNSTLPQQVLATTFTRAAASEILERVLRRLALAVVSTGERRQLLSEIGRAELTLDDLTRLLKSVCESLPLLQIGTIDALFARIIRVIGLDLAFPTAWRIADETETNDLALQAADRMLTGPEATLSRDQWLRYSQFASRVEVRAKLVKLLEQNRFLLADSPIDADNPDHQRPLVLTPEEMVSMAADLENIDGLPRNQNGRPNEHWRRAIETLRSRLVDELQLIDLLDHKLFLCAGEARGTYYKHEAPESLRKILGPLVARAVEDLGRLHMARLPALAAMAKRYHEFRRVVSYAGSTYGFAEIEAAARLLPDHIFQEDIYFRLDGTVRHLLLDEFQDTSLGQFRFLWQLMTELRSEDRMLFVVGDVKQSIYGFRGADRHLLNRLRGWLDPKDQDRNLQALTLTQNYRSAPAVLDAVHRVFSRLDQLVCLDPAAYKDSAKNQQAQVRRKAALAFLADYCELAPAGDNAQQPGRVRLIVTDSDEAETGADVALPGELRAIVEAAVGHYREDPVREIAILCRRRKWMPSIIAGLRRQGIESSGEGGSPVTDSAAVELVLSMLTWLDHPGHTLARGHVELSGLSALFGIEPGVQDLFLPKRIQAEIMRAGLAPTIAGWIRTDAFRQRGTVHDQIRCEQLIELARHWDAAGGGRLAHFVDRVHAQKLDNPVASRVRVMTIHGSKGLEFDAVILADLQSPGGSVGDVPRFLVRMTSPEAPPEVQLVPRSEVGEILGLQQVTQDYLQDQFEEDLSVLYVGLTRAKSYLDVVVAAPKKTEPSLTGILVEGWGNAFPGIHIVEQNQAGPSGEKISRMQEMPDDDAIWERGGGLRLAGFRAAPERLAAITPSSQEGSHRIKLGQILSSGNAAALERGTAVHALLSRLEWLETVPSIDEWVRSVPEGEVRATSCRAAARELQPRLARPRDPLTQIFTASAWMARWQKDGVRKLEVWRERRFAVVLDKELMNGSFDRVVFGLDAEEKIVRAEILDFKTDRVTEGFERKERLRFYQPQLDAYARALAALTGQSAAAIHTRLVWID